MISLVFHIISFPVSDKSRFDTHWDTTRIFLNEKQNKNKMGWRNWIKFCYNTCSNFTLSVNNPTDYSAQFLIFIRLVIATEFERGSLFQLIWHVCNVVRKFFQSWIYRWWFRSHQYRWKCVDDFTIIRVENKRLIRTFRTLYFFRSNS